MSSGAGEGGADAGVEEEAPKGTREEEEQKAAAAAMGVDDDRALSEADKARAAKAFEELLRTDAVRRQSLTLAEQILKKVPIDTSHVALLRSEFGLETPAAQRALRQAGGNLQLAIQRLVGLAPDDGGEKVLRMAMARLA